MTASPTSPPARLPTVRMTATSATTTVRSISVTSATIRLMTHHEHGLGDFFADMAAQRLPPSGVFYVRGGYEAINGMRPAYNDGSRGAKAVQALFQGDDDHPGYSDSGISEALIAREVDAVARSPYWKNCAIIITYDESEGDYDHVPPRILSFDPNGLPLSRGAAHSADPHLALCARSCLVA